MNYGGPRPVRRQLRPLAFRPVLRLRLLAACLRMIFARHVTAADGQAVARAARTPRLRSPGWATRIVAGAKDRRVEELIRQSGGSRGWRIGGPKSNPPQSLVVEDVTLHP